MDVFWGKMLSFWFCILFHVLFLLFVLGSKKILVCCDDVLRFPSLTWLTGLVLLTNLHYCMQIETFLLSCDYLMHVRLSSLEGYIMFDSTRDYIGARLIRGTFFRLWHTINLGLMGKGLKQCNDPAPWHSMGPVLENG